jgi:hypothetical protein
MPMLRILTASALSLPDNDPIGRSIAGNAGLFAPHGAGCCALLQELIFKRVRVFKAGVGIGSVNGCGVAGVR